MVRFSSVVVVLCLTTLALLSTASSAVEKTDADETMVLELHCNRGTADVRSMEHTYLEQACWGHLGIHTYFVGQDTTYALHGGSGRAFSVEQQLTPPIEALSYQTHPPQVFSPLPIETSLDGIEWTKVAAVEYRLAGTLPGGTSLRQDIYFDFEADEEPFRYLRIRQPLSAAQGLSGYLDLSAFTIEVSEVAAPPMPVPMARQGFEMTCDRDIMESVWAAHPCWFGGINRYDTPSFFHTYPVEGAVLDRVEGSALFSYWRPEDPGTCCGQNVPGMLGGPVFLQSSLDGVEWEVLGTFDATYGVPLSFAVELDGHEANFLRLVSDKHPGYWNHPALKRAEAYLLHSELRLDGLVA